MSNNIAEGYHKTTVREKVKYLNVAKGEAEETKRGLLKSARKKFLAEDIAIRIAERYTVLLKGMSSYIRFLELNESGRGRVKKRS